MTKPKFSKLEVYITNVCNLTCEHCNRFNNFDFKGWQRWSDHAEEYRRWGELIDVNAVTVMGGEPTLNPTLSEWILGLNSTLGADVQVLTNGTRLNQSRGLYDAINRIAPNGANNSIAISLHNPEELNRLKDDVAQFLHGTVRENTHSPKTWGCDYQFSDDNGVLINVYFQNKFDTSSITVTPDGRYTVFDNDPASAFRACTFAVFKSYHFIRGKLYKCGPSALLPEFDDQHKFDISEEDRKLMHSYQPLTVDNFAEYHEEFLESLNNPIPQCKFCPVFKSTIAISPVRKGSSS